MGDSRVSRGSGGVIGRLGADRCSSDSGHLSRAKRGGFARKRKAHTRHGGFGTAPSGRLPKSPDWIRLNFAPAIDPRIRARKPRPMARSHPPDAKGDRRTKKPASLSLSDVLRRGARAPIGVISVPGCAGGAIRASRAPAILDADRAGLRRRDGGQHRAFRSGAGTLGRDWLAGDLRRTRRGTASTPATRDDRSTCAP